MKNEKFIYLFGLVSLFSIFFTKPVFVFAKSSYVLPYPTFMPGSFLYKPHLFLEEILRFWYFGNLGQFKYTLRESDKYLVEAKTLFEYQQYLLGYKALKRSDSYFVKVHFYLINAQKEGKDITSQQAILIGAGLKHKEVLLKLKKGVPETFFWQPEKSQPTKLDLHDAIFRSISLREKDI